MDSVHLSFTATDRSYIAILKKDIRNLVSNVGLTTRRQAEVDIIVAEMASNLVKHGAGGEILARAYDDKDNGYIELISIDHGVGISDVSSMMKDGVSTTNTLGQGLGAIKRLSDHFDIYSVKNWGTIVLSRVFRKSPDHITTPISEIRSIVVAKPNEKACGDGYYVKQSKDNLKIFIGDGLGHGEEAKAATNEAIRAFRLCSEVSPAEIIRVIHPSVKRTRGLVGTIATFNFKEKKWSIAGVGNIMTRLHNAYPGKNFLSYNGIIGMNIPTTIKDQEFGHEYGQILVMCSDGIKTRWENQKYPAIFKHDLSVFAAALYKDFARKTDDMSIIVARIN